VFAAQDLQETLVAAAPLVLTGLSVAFAFRVGLFNIGAQGQYTVGSVIAVWVATSFTGLNPVLHIVVSILAAALIGGAWAALAGWLKATVGTHEVISTIMLNWIAIWIASYLFQQGGPLQGKNALGNPVSNTIANNMHLPVIWGNPALQGLDVGVFVGIGAAVVFWAIMNRSTLGYEVRAVGHNPDAARGSGISVPRNYIMTMAICGVFAGLAASIDVLGWEFQVSSADLFSSQVGFLGIAVALLGRNTAIGVVAAALLFGALETGTSAGNLTSTSLNPELAPQLTLIIEGLVVLLVSTDLIAVRILGLPRKLGWGRPEAGADLAEALQPDDPSLDAAEALRPEPGR
jgi:simple sugar transport system permease protein